jgi:putative ABC transport system permease protein
VRTLVETVLLDLRYAARLLVRQPAASALSIGLLACGIGGATALFSVIDAAMLRPLPYPNPEQLVTIKVESRGGRLLSAPINPSVDHARDWSRASRTLSHVAASHFGPELILDDGLEPERAPDLFGVRRVTDRYIEMLGVAPILGRGFGPADLSESGPLVALIGERLWRSRYGGDPGIVGRAIRIHQTSHERIGMPATIVGVLPRSVSPEAWIWLPLRSAGQATVEGRLRPGVTLADAERELSALPLRALDPDWPLTGRVQVTSTVEYLSANGFNHYRLRELTAAVALILLLACVNVAGLLLARGAGRQSELAVRASLGATRARLIRQQLTESVVLSIAAALAGIVLAWWSLDLLLAGLQGLPERSDVNPRVLGASVGFALATAAAVGCFPAIRLSRVRLGPLAASRPTGTGHALTRRGGQWLVGIEIALAVLLLAGAMLVVRDFARLAGADTGVDLQRLMILDVGPLDEREEVLTSYYPALLRAVRALPEVEAAGISHAGRIGQSNIAATGASDAAVSGRLYLQYISPGYLEALGVPVRAGRLPTEADAAQGPAAGAVLNETAARQFFPLGSAIGRTIDVPARRYHLSVMGVVADNRLGIRTGAVTPQVYLMMWREVRLRTAVVMRVRADTPTLRARLRETAHNMGPRVVVDGVRSGTEWFREQWDFSRSRTYVLAAFGLVGVLLALVGIAAVTAYSVARRTQEIGIRVALGAVPARIVRSVVGDVVVPVAVGLAAGLIAVLLAKRALATFLLDMSPDDPATLAMVAVGLAASASVAAWLPARRAARVDPIRALRAE